MGCLGVRLLHPYSRLLTIPCGYICGQVLRGAGQMCMQRCGCMPLGPSLPLFSLSGPGLASEEPPWLLLLLLRIGLHCGGHLWMGVGGGPQAGDEDVACVLSLASLWEAQLADSSLAELRAEGRSCLRSFREVLCYCRVGGWERKGLRSQRAPSLATSVQTSLSILG